MTELNLTESELEAYFDLSADLFCRICSDGYVEKLNGQWENILGWTPLESRSDPWINFLHPDDAEPTLRAIEQCGAGKVCQFENRYRHKNGLYLWLSWKATRTENGWCALAKDITANKRLERQMSRQQERLNAFFTSAPVGLAILDKQLRFVQLNHTLLDMNGGAAPVYFGKTFREVLPQLAPAVEPLLHGVLASGAPALNAELTTGLNPQARSTWQASIFPIQDESGQLKSIGLILTEITSRVGLQEALRHRLAVEEAVAHISRLFLWGQVSLNKVLEILGEAVVANRAYIFEFSEDGSKAHNTHEWCAPGTPPHIARLQELDTAEFIWWAKQLSRGENITVSDVSALSGKAAGEKNMLAGRTPRPSDVRSLVAVPIHSTTGTLLGFIGFDDTEKCRTWLPEEVRALRVVSEMISSDWEAQQAKAELSPVQRTLRERNSCDPEPIRATSESELL
jgi:PAS domain S-box-containing protein